MQWHAWLIAIPIAIAAAVVALYFARVHSCDVQAQRALITQQSETGDSPAAYHEQHSVHVLRNTCDVFISYAPKALRNTRDTPTPAHTGTSIQVDTSLPTLQSQAR